MGITLPLRTSLELLSSVPLTRCYGTMGIWKVCLRFSQKIQNRKRDNSLTRLRPCRLKLSGLFPFNPLQNCLADRSSSGRFQVSVFLKWGYGVQFVVEAPT